MKFKEIRFDFGRKSFPIRIPDHTDIYPMGKASPLSNPGETIRSALRNPSDCPPLKELVKQKLLHNPQAKAVVVISDSTRPVPYTGDSGILVPIIEEMIGAGLKPSQIRLLIATGTHRPMNSKELREFLDPKIFSWGLQIINHVCAQSKELICVGRTKLGGEILINRNYMESDIKILTGLVESHFMAGVSGGRKSICPGLLSEKSTHILHNGPILSSEKARDLVLPGNPVHEETLRVAKMAGCDMIVNVTLDSSYRITGIFAGDMEEAHLEAVKKLQSYVAIPVHKKYDIVITHAGFVGVNHYQAAKGALIGIPLLNKNGIYLLAALHTDIDPIGSSNYKDMMRLLGKLGSKKFLDRIMDPSWTFTPDQWEAQMWTRLFMITAPENLLYCSLEISKDAFTWLPGIDARALVPETDDLKELIEETLNWAVEKFRTRFSREPQIAVLPDGPYGIPVYKEAI